MSRKPCDDNGILDAMPKTVLVADDNEMVRREICRLLIRETEIEVCEEARDGLDAIHKAQELNPHLIILDLSMPIMNGVDAARVLRTRMPAIPIIMFTSHDDPLLQQELLSVGLTAVVSKSDSSALTQKARTLLQNAA